MLYHKSDSYLFDASNDYPHTERRTCHLDISRRAATQWVQHFGRYFYFDPTSYTKSNTSGTLVPVRREPWVK